MLPQVLTALVADDHELFGHALKVMLQRDLEFTDVSLALCFDRAVKTLTERPDTSLLTLDLGMPGMAGSCSVREIRRSFPEVRIIIVSASASREQVLEALSWGIHGYLPKTLSTDAFVHAFRTVLDGQIYVPPTLSNLTENVLETGPQPNPGVSRNMNESGRRLGDCVEMVDRSLGIFSVDLKLSDRQKEVLDLLAQGKSNKEIARALGLAEGTVKAHINGLYRVLNVHNRAGAVATRTVAPRSLSAIEALTAANVAQITRTSPTYS